ncbi:attractin protein 1 [Elysia marginata]|uniref:Attractin protein 1 n=1 Tax=Elysia marginata TaxID=1093978 RepID=A0AAV4J942_9GAST|nr:attractin protein 1 [Elysia marginata]
MRCGFFFDVMQHDLAGIEVVVEVVVVVGLPVVVVVVVLVVVVVVVVVASYLILCLHVVVAAAVVVLAVAATLEIVAAAVVVVVVVVRLVAVVVVTCHVKTSRKCTDGTCVCYPGFRGSNCNECYGRVRLQPGKSGVIYDGAADYKKDLVCSWLLDAGQDNMRVQFEFNSFSTECSWDHLYIHNGDSSFAPLAGAFSGIMGNASQKPHLKFELSGRYVFIHLYSDAAYTLPGFNISYLFDDCDLECSENGVCNNSACECQPGWSGPNCTVFNEGCLFNCTDHGICQQGKCQCDAGYRGHYCEMSNKDIYIKPVDVQGSIPNGRASAPLVYDGSGALWLFGGFQMGMEQTGVNVYKEAIRGKRPGQLTKGVILQHDNATPHTARVTQGWLEKYGWEISPHPPHSPDLAPSDYHLFGPLKRELAGKRFDDDEELVDHVRKRLQNLGGSFFREGIYSMVWRWQKCVDRRREMKERSRFIIASKTWLKAIEEQPTSNPWPRYGHTVVFHKGKFYLFGGVSKGKVKADLWSFDMATRRWTELAPGPRDLSGHTAHVVNDTMVVIFGYSSFYSYSNKVLEYIIGTGKWVIVKTTGAEVRGGYGHGSVYDADRSLIFVSGGYLSIGSTTYNLTDRLYQYDPIKREWYILSNSRGARYLHSAAMMNGLMITFGGSMHNNSQMGKQAKCSDSDFMVYDREGGKGAPPVPSISMATAGSSSAPLQTKHNKGKGVGKNSRWESDTSKRNLTPLQHPRYQTRRCSNERSEGGQDDDLKEALADLEEHFLQDQHLGEKLNGIIADIVNKGMLTVAHRDKGKKVVANYPPPANIPNPVTPKMNGELWEMLPSFARTRDLNSQKTISMVMTMMTISARMMNLLYSDKTSSPTTRYLRSLVADQLRLGSDIFADLNQREEGGNRSHHKGSSQTGQRQ